MESDQKQPANAISIVQLHPDDNVAVALSSVVPGTVFGDVRVAEPIPAGHKFALREIVVDGNVVKYGFCIGRATATIQAGSHVHEHNLSTALNSQKGVEFQPGEGTERQIDIGTDEFRGFQRPGGRVAARNEIWILNTVACVNQTAARLAERANRELRPQYPDLDGFYSFPHPYGCSQLGDDLQSTRKILAGMINHPHAGAVLLLGLGCENNRMDEQMKMVDPARRHLVRGFNTQQVGDELEEGFQLLSELAALANQPRQQLRAADLILAMKCGGSDGFSGITANPLVGRIADRHCQSGGTVLLTEVPEMFGAEEVLLRRCATKEVFIEAAAMVEEFKQYFRQHGQPISENPSPGNRDGGITTLEEKSLGCVQKAGVDSLVRQVVPYGGVATPGLGGIALINGPGNDGVSITAMTAAGANMILFTTGRGTPMGAPIPTLKIATNSSLANNKPSWIDFNAGRLIDCCTSLDELAGELYSQILRQASGEEFSKNEVNGYREIAIWKTGVTL